MDSCDAATVAFCLNATPSRPAFPSLSSHFSTPDAKSCQRLSFRLATNDTLTKPCLTPPVDFPIPLIYISVDLPLLTIRDLLPRRHPNPKPAELRINRHYRLSLRHLVRILLRFHKSNLCALERLPLTDVLLCLEIISLGTTRLHRLVPSDSGLTH